MSEKNKQANKNLTVYSSGYWEIWVSVYKSILLQLHVNAHTAYKPLELTTFSDILNLW